MHIASTGKVDRGGVASKGAKKKRHRRADDDGGRKEEDLAEPTTLGKSDSRDADMRSFTSPPNIDGGITDVVALKQSTSMPSQGGITHAQASKSMEVQAATPGATSMPSHGGIAHAQASKSVELQAVTTVVTSMRCEDPSQETATAARIAIQRRRWYNPGLGFMTYFGLNLLSCAIPSVLVLGCFSDALFVEDVYRYASDNSSVQLLLGGIATILLVVLYMLDFFAPPHLPGQALVLWNGDHFVGRCLFLISVLCFFATGFFFVQDLSYIPVLQLICLGPAMVMLMRLLTRPKKQALLANWRKVDLEHAALQDRVDILRVLTGADLDAQLFWTSSLISFLVVGVTLVVWWSIWAIKTCPEPSTAAPGEDVAVVVHWLAPCMAGISNLIFAAIVSVRVSLTHKYEATDSVKLKLLRSGTHARDVSEALAARSGSLVATHMKEVDVTSPDADRRMLEDNQLRHMTLLLSVFKYTSLCFFVIICALWIVTSLINEHKKLVKIGMYFVASWLVIYICFMLFYFRRLMVAMIDWVQKLPMYKMTLAAYNHPWGRGLLVAAFGPSVPLIAAVSIMNQLVRNLRGLEQSPEDASRWLTARVALIMDHFRTWDWVSLMDNVYICAVGLQVFSYSTVMTNVLLSWLISLLEALHLVLVVVMAMAAGLVCFMCPVIPGIPVYLFCGALIPPVAEKEEWKDSVGGYPGGCLIAVATGFVLKLMACAMQQVGFGGLLGQVAAVRRACGVHKPILRSFAGVLQEPGLTWGKVMIACGGPDWPTSVLAGLVRVPLLQMLIATIPIIFFITPCTLTGCFYVKSTTDNILKSLYTLMVILSVGMSAAMNMGAIIAMQSEMLLNYWEHTKPLEENVDLEWLDHVADVIASRTPPPPERLKIVYFSGAALECMLVWLFWGGEMVLGTPLFGNFQVTDDISKLVGYDPDAPKSLFKTVGLCAMIASAVGLCGMIVYGCWRKQSQKCIKDDIMDQLRIQEPVWKAKRISQARMAERIDPEKAPKKPGDPWPDLSDMAKE